jgi:hypothetical protein
MNATQLPISILKVSATSNDDLIAEHSRTKKGKIIKNKILDRVIEKRFTFYPYQAKIIIKVPHYVRN